MNESRCVPTHAFTALIRSTMDISTALAPTRLPRGFTVSRTFRISSCCERGDYLLGDRTPGQPGGLDAWSAEPVPGQKNAFDLHKRGLVRPGRPGLRPV